MSATLAAARKTGGGTSTMSSKDKAPGKGAFNIGDKAKTLFANLKTALVPMLVALIAVAIAARWAKRDEKNGKPTFAFPFIAAAVAWLVPEMVLHGRSRVMGVGGILSQSALRLAGAFAFLLALTFDDILGPIVEKARLGGDQTMNFVSRVFWWAAELFSGKDAAVAFTSRAAALPPAASGASAAQGQSSSYSPPAEQYFAATQPAPAAQPAPQPAQQPAGGGDLAGAIFGFLGQAAQALPGVIAAFNPPAAQNNPGGQAGLSGLDPYRVLSRAA